MHVKVLLIKKRACIHVLETQEIFRNKTFEKCKEVPLCKGSEGEKLSRKIHCPRINHGLSILLEMG